MREWLCTSTIVLLSHLNSGILFIIMNKRITEWSNNNKNVFKTHPQPIAYIVDGILISSYRGGVKTNSIFISICLIYQVFGELWLVDKVQCEKLYANQTKSPERLTIRQILILFFGSSSMKTDLAWDFYRGSLIKTYLSCRNVKLFLLRVHQCT